MQARKLVLAVSFFVVVILLFTVVFMAKNQRGNFGRDYDKYVSANVEKYASWFTNRREEVYNEVKNLALDKLLFDMIKALYGGEDISLYASEMNRIVTKLSHAKKIQLLDPTGIVVYSSESGEALVNRFVPDLLTQAEQYQTTMKKPFLRFVSTNECFVMQPLKEEEKVFQVVVYYDTKRFAHPDYGLMIPWGKTLLVGKEQKGSQEAARIVEYASVDPAALTRGQKTIGGMKEVDGIQLVYFSRYDRYVSTWVIGIIVFSFVLLFLILYAFFRLLHEEKQYKQPLTFRHTPRTDLKDLVEEIEEGVPISSEEAKKGIEEMLMSENIEDLTRSDEFPFEKPATSSEEGHASMGEAVFAEKSISEPPLLGEEEWGQETLSPQKEVSTESILSSWEETPSLSGVSSTIFKTDEATKLFAEQDRLLDEVGHDMMEEDLSSVKEKEEFSLEPSFLASEEEPSSGEMTIEPEFLSKQEKDSSSLLPDLEKEMPLTFEEPSFASSEEYSEPLSQPEEKPISLELEPEVLPLGEEEMNPVEDNLVLAEYSSPMEREETKEERAQSYMPVEEISLESIDIPEFKEESISSFEGFEETMKPEDVSDALVAQERGEEETANLSLADTLLEEIAPVEEVLSPEDEVIALNMDELSTIPIEESEQKEETMPETLALSEPVLEENIVASQSKEEKQVVMFGEEVHHDLAKLLSEPPKRLSTIHDVMSYAHAAHDIAKRALNMNRVCVLEKKGDRFENVFQEGFVASLNFSLNDPIYKKILSKQKSLDIQNNLEKASYLKQWFGDGELAHLEELFIVPVVERGEVVGVGVYGREKGVAEATDLQKSELYNIGFLQEVE